MHVLVDDKDYVVTGKNKHPYILRGLEFDPYPTEQNAYIVFTEVELLLGI